MTDTQCWPAESGDCATCSIRWCCDARMCPRESEDRVHDTDIPRAIRDQDADGLREENERLKRCYATATGKAHGCGAGAVIRVECKQMAELRAENTRARDALYDAICAVSNGKLCMQGAYNVHAPQISTERVARWRDALKEDTP